MTKTNRDNVLYITPIMPRRFGNGLAMRAASVLEALATRFDVHLYVVPVAGDRSAPSDFVLSHTKRIEQLDLAKNLDPLFGLISRLLDPAERRRAELAYPKPSLSRFCTGDSADRIRQWMNEVPFAGVHLMRLYLAPLALPFLRLPASERPFCVLDLDDDDVRTYEQLAKLHAHWGDHRAVASTTAEAKKYRAFGDQYIPGFDRAIVCSQADANQMALRFPATRFAVIPNGYAAMEHIQTRRLSSDGPLRLLFVGSFGYFPNLDAALFLWREVLPALRRLTQQEIRIELVGEGNLKLLSSLIQDPYVVIRGFVEDLAPLYAGADVAIVPMRGGGGTRIKILEAFAYGVPVVATRLGAEGIDANDEEHILLADAPQDFAQACLRVKSSPELSSALASRAAALLDARYSPVQVKASVDAVWNLHIGS